MTHASPFLRRSIWMIILLVVCLHLVAASDPASATTITQDVKQRILADFDVSLTIADSIHQEILSNRKVFKELQCKKCRQDEEKKPSKIGTLIKGAETIATYMNYVSIVTTVGKKVLSLFTGKGTEEEDPFDKLNDKLNAISREINNLRDELKASIEFNTWLVHEADYEAKIRAGEECLDETLYVMNNVTDEKQKMKFALEFINCFESYQIEASTQEIYRLSGKPPSPTSQNLFELFVKEKGCDVLELSRLMMMMRDLMTSAAKQSMVYYFFKDGNENRVGKSMTKYQTYLYDIRDYYDTQVWHCFRDSIKNAKTIVTKTIDENMADPSSLSSIIHEKLVNIIPWYSWTVAQFEKNSAPSVTLHPLLGGHSVTFNAEGETYFMIPEHGSSDTNVIVVWQDSEDVFRSCDEIDISKTKVFFNPCEGCSSSSFVNSENMMLEHTCTDYLREMIHEKASSHYNENKLLKYLSHHPVSFTIADKGIHKDACIDDPCLNGGVCNSINYTNSRFCICKPFYEGEDCEIDVGTSLADNVTAVLAKLREEFGIMTGIPDVIDIYFQIKDLANDIKDMQKSIHDYSEYENLITLYGKSIKEAEYISKYHTDFQNEKLNLKNFGKLIDKFDFDYILLDFSQMITGEAIMVDDDFITSKKKALSKDYGACTEDYSLAVNSLMRNIVTLDQVVVESRLWHARWDLENTQSITVKMSILSDVHQTYKYALERQKQYYDNWSIKSCPELFISHGKISGIDDRTIHCNQGLSFEGLTVNIECMNYTMKTSNHHNVSCVRAEDGTLVWTDIPTCELEEVWWGNWTDWSDCDASCDNGTQIRYKWSNIGNIMNETRSCSTGVRCCMQSEFICDGNDDCMEPWGDNADEEGCIYLRVGHTIAIKSDDRWLTCAAGEAGRICTSEACGGTYMNTDDWDRCPSQVFDYVAAEGRTKDQAIRHGDRIGIRYSWPRDDQTNDRYWLTCQNDAPDHCETHNCPGKYFEDFLRCSGEKYWILSDTRKGNCNFGDVATSGCIGEPIQPKDVIYLLHDPADTGMWVSGGVCGSPRLATCDVRNDVANNNGANCYCEKWVLNIKEYTQ